MVGRLHRKVALTRSRVFGVLGFLGFLGFRVLGVFRV